jgi:hypothetical protein
MVIKCIKKELQWERTKTPAFNLLTWQSECSPTWERQPAQRKSTPLLGANAAICLLIPAQVSMTVKPKPNLRPFDPTAATAN